jgi:hypothetical protein
MDKAGSPNGRNAGYTPDPISYDGSGFGGSSSRHTIVEIEPFEDRGPMRRSDILMA